MPRPANGSPATSPPEIQDQEIREEQPVEKSGETTLPSSPVLAIPSGKDFTPAEQALGQLLLAQMPATIAHILRVGKELTAAHQSLAQRGCASLYGKFCDTYLPALDRKTLDRWRTSYAAFQNLIDLERIGTECPDSLGNIRLTALYRLTKSDANESHRRAALSLAGQGMIVSESMAIAVIHNTSVARRHKSTATHKKTIRLSVGTVKLDILRDDYRQVLEAAILKIDREVAANG